MNDEIWEGLSQIEGARGKMMNKLISHSLSGLRWRDLRVIGGSNEEKMSVNMKI